MANGYVGCIYGVNFPVLMRSTFGVCGAYFAVFVRGAVACICKCRFLKSFDITNSRQGSVLKVSREDNASKQCCKPSGPLTKVSQTIFQQAHMSPLLNCSASSSSSSFNYPIVAECLQVEVSVYRKDDCDANIRSYALHLGSRGRYVKCSPSLLPF
jgi:Permease for cytosine/purines, uracil, thiamine, allantoin